MGMLAMASGVALRGVGIGDRAAGGNASARSGSTSGGGGPVEREASLAPEIPLPLPKVGCVGVPVYDTVAGVTPLGSTAVEHAAPLPEGAVAGAFGGSPCCGTGASPGDAISLGRGSATAQAAVCKAGVCLELTGLHELMLSLVYVLNAVCIAATIASVYDSVCFVSIPAHGACGIVHVHCLLRYCNKCGIFVSTRQGFLMGKPNVAGVIPATPNAHP
jgi:hypothetical protein